MLVTDRFVFLHLHKTAGTSFNSFIQTFFPKNEWIGYHLPLHVLPVEWSHLPTLGMVRNPWEFYVSWYSFQMQKERSNPLFNVVSEGRTLNFNNTIRRLLTLCENHHLLNKVASQLPNHFTGGGMNVPAYAIAKMSGTNQGLYSFLHQWMYGGTPLCPTIIKTENMLLELGQFFESIGVIFTNEMRENLEAGSALNRSRHQHYSTYYEADVVALVGLLDKTLIEQYDFRFG